MERRFPLTPESCDARSLSDTPRNSRGAIVLTRVGEDSDGDGVVFVSGTDAEEEG